MRYGAASTNPRPKAAMASAPTRGAVLTEMGVDAGVDLAHDMRFVGIGDRAASVCPLSAPRRRAHSSCTCAERFWLAESRSMSSRISRMVVRWSPSWCAIIMSGPLFPTNEPPISATAVSKRNRRYLSAFRRIQRSFRPVEFARKLSRIPSTIFWITLFRSMTASGFKSRRADLTSVRLQPGRSTDSGTEGVSGARNVRD